MNEDGEAVSQDDRKITIRFPHVDHAGIMFYPRYIEILQANFPALPLFTMPSDFKIEFIRPNRLGDTINLVARHVSEPESWSVTGEMHGDKHFVFRSTNATAARLSQHAHRAHQGAFKATALSIGAWAVGEDKRLFLSRYFELQNVAVEEWFEDTLEIPFFRLHVDQRIGIPTVKFKTQCRKLPRAGDQVQMWLQPTRIGRRSMTSTSWLVCDDECLVETEQVVVFVRMLENGYETVPIPQDILTAFQNRMVA